MSILRKSSVTVPEFHAAAPRAMSAVLSSLGPLSVMGSGKTYQVSLLSTNHSTAAVNWTERAGGLIEVQLVLPALKADARITRAEADKFGAYWVHELCHVLFTEDADWRVACGLGAEVKNLTNGLEDARIEAKLIASGALPGAREMLSSLLSSMVSEMPGLVTAGVWGHRSRWPWTLAVMGRAALWGFSHPALPDVAALPLPLQTALRDLVGATSTADCVAIARGLAGALANPGSIGNGKPGKGPRDPGAGAEAGDGEAAEGMDGGSEAGGGNAGGLGAGAGSPEDFANDREGDCPDISAGYSRIVQRIAGKNRGTEGEAEAANALRDAKNSKGFGRAGLRVASHWNLDVLVAAQEARLAEMGAGALRASIRNMLRAPEARATRRYQDSGRLDMRGLHRIEAGRTDVFTRKNFRPGVETAVGVLCDASGSMGNGAYQVPVTDDTGATYTRTVQVREIAADTGRAIVDACNFAGAPVMAAVFNHHIRWLVGGKIRAKGRDAKVNWGKAAVYSDGSTATVGAMLSMARELDRAYPNMRKVMLVLTDGQADEGPEGVRAASHFCLSEFGVECIGVGMGYDIGDQFPMAVTLPVHDAKPETFLAILAKGLAKGAPVARAA